MMDDQLLAEDLRAIFDEHSALGDTVVDRRVAVNRRIVDHRRVRALRVLCAVLLVAGSVASALVLPHGHRTPVRPAVTPSPAAGTMAEYANGGHLVASGRIDLSRQTSGTLTFLLTSVDMQIGGLCTADAKDWMTVQIDGRAFLAGGCATYSGSIGGPSFFDKAGWWKRFGVRMGDTVTVSFRVGKQASHLAVAPITSANGFASVGVYAPVPFEQFPLPPKPAGWDRDPSAIRMGIDKGMHAVAQLASPTLRDGTAREQLTLPSTVEVVVAITSPGVVGVYFDKVEVFECASYGWGGGCDSGTIDIGSDATAGFASGQTVSVSIQTSHFTQANTVQATVYGK